jgi:hypothetical protein
MGFPLSATGRTACVAKSHNFRHSAWVVATAASLAAIVMLPACSEPRQANAAQPRLERDYASLYAEDTLAKWETRYKPAIQYNLIHLIIDSLSPAQLRKMRGWTFQFPRRDRKDPLAFYASHPPPTITMSVASVKFLDDFAAATAWLEENGYSVETTAYYADVLKYRDSDGFPNGRYPPPLLALGIPADALKNEVVNDIALKTLNSAMVFSLAHEVGHLVNGHETDVSAERRQQQEMQADSFAINAFRCIGVTPVGIVTFFFMASRLGAHRGDFESDSAWALWLRTHADHPLSSRRLKALADALKASPEAFARSDTNPGALDRVLFIAKQIEGMSTILDDPALHKQARDVGQQIPLTELAPRRAGHPWSPK